MGKVLDYIKGKIDEVNPVTKIAKQVQEAGSPFTPQKQYEAQTRAMNRSNPYFKAQEVPTELKVKKFKE